MELGKKEAKATLLIFIMLILLIRLFLAAVLALIFSEASALLIALNIFLLIFSGILSILVVWLIPLQLIRYCRKLRALR